jgi:hypothetical protein
MAKSNKKSTGKAGETPTGKHYQEWRVEIKAEMDGDKVVKKYEKLKISRPCVKITDQEAETLNNGVLEGPNTFSLMYFKAEGAEKTEEAPAAEGDILD